MPREPSARDVALALLRQGAQLLPADAAALLSRAWEAGDGEDELCALAIAALPLEPLSAALPQGYAESRRCRPGMCRAAAAALVREARLAGVDWRGPAQDAAAGGGTHLTLAAAEPGDANGPLCAALCSVARMDPNAADAAGDTALFVAARAGNASVCRALVEQCGADVLHRNARNRTAGGQAKLPEAARAYLAEAEDAAKRARAERVRAWFDPKIAATQTASACIVQTV